MSDSCVAKYASGHEHEGSFRVRYTNFNLFDKSNRRRGGVLRYNFTKKKIKIIQTRFFFPPQRTRNCVKASKNEIRPKRWRRRRRYETAYKDRAFCSSSSLSLSLSTILMPWPRGDEPRTKLQNRVFYTVLHCIYSAVSSRHTRWTVVVVRSIFRITQTFISMYTVTLRNSPISFPLPPSIYTRLENFFFFFTLYLFITR